MQVLQHHQTDFFFFKSRAEWGQWSWVSDWQRAPICLFLRHTLKVREEQRSANSLKHILINAILHAFSQQPAIVHLLSTSCMPGSRNANIYDQGTCGRGGLEIVALSLPVWVMLWGRMGQDKISWHKGHRSRDARVTWTEDTTTSWRQPGAEDQVGQRELSDLRAPMLTGGWRRSWLPKAKWAPRLLSRSALAGLQVHHG